MSSPMLTSASRHVRAIRRAHRGISLIEALVAMAIMAFGMLGVLGLQSTLRASADLSKQRSEATRLAQEKVEDWRSFSVVPVTAGVKSYAGIAPGTTVESLVSFISNATYTRTSTVTETPAQKTLRVNVSWEDRAGTTQNVSLFSVVARVSPDLAATMVAAPVGAGGTREPQGRRRGIPPQAVNFGDGTSGFRPPQPPGPGVAWVFNNVTGLITSVCTTSVAVITDAADVTSCVSTQKYQLIWGFIRFDLTSPPTDASLRGANDDVPGTVQAEVIQPPPAALPAPVCLHGYADANLAPTAPFKLAAFFCPVPVISTSTPAFAWSGTLQVRPISMPVANPLSAAGTYATDAATANRKVCRLRAAGTYADVTEPLGNQNMFVIGAGNGTTPNVCPTTVPPVYFGHQPTPP